MLLSIAFLFGFVFCTSYTADGAPLSLIKFIESYSADENGPLTVSILAPIISAIPSEELFQEKHSYADAMLLLFQQEIVDSECVQLLVDIGFPINYEHLYQAVMLNNRVLYDIMFNGKDINGAPVKNSFVIFSNLLKQYLSGHFHGPEIYTIDGIRMILDSFKEFGPSNIQMRDAIMAKDDKLIRCFLNYTQDINEVLVNYVLGSCHDALLVQVLLDKGMDPNYCLNSGPTPLLAAVSKTGDAFGLCQNLIVAGANLYHVPRTGPNVFQRALHQPDISQRLKILLLLNRYGVSLSDPSSENMSFNAYAKLHLSRLQTAYELFKAFSRPDNDSWFASIPPELRSSILHMFLADCLCFIVLVRPPFVDHPIAIPYDGYQDSSSEDALLMGSQDIEIDYSDDDGSCWGFSGSMLQ